MNDSFWAHAVRVALVGVFAILSLFLLAETVNVTENFGRPANAATDTVTVSSDGQATLPPDVAQVSFTVQNTASAVSAAQTSTTDQTNQVLAFLKTQGIADTDIQTLSYNISPQYASSCVPGTFCPANSSSAITGYQVADTIQVSVHDLSQVGTILAGLGKLQVQNISGPAFALQDPTEGYDAARADAIQKAKTQAALLASQLGVSLGKIVNFSESNGSNQVMPVTYNAELVGGSAASTPTVPSGENTYSASVSITYEI